MSKLGLNKLALGLIVSVVMLLCVIVPIDATITGFQSGYAYVGQSASSTSSPGTSVCTAGTYQVSYCLTGYSFVTTYTDQCNLRDSAGTALVLIMVGPIPTSQCGLVTATFSGSEAPYVGAYTGATGPITCSLSYSCKTSSGVPDINVKQWAGTAPTVATAGVVDINVKNIGNSAISQSAGVQSVSTGVVQVTGVAAGAVVISGAVTTTGTATVSGTVAVSSVAGTVVTTLSGSSFTGSSLNVAVTSTSGTTSPVYPTGSVVSAFPTLYHSPIFGNVMPHSAFYHACVNSTGNFNSGLLFRAPNGTCGFEASVSVSTTTTSMSAVTIGGFTLNNLTVTQASVVGTGSSYMSNVYLDDCTGQGNYVFLNTTAPDGVQCVDITIALNNGPNFLAQSVLPTIGYTTSGSCANAAETGDLYCYYNITGNDQRPIIAVNTGLNHVVGRVSCASIPTVGITVAFEDFGSNFAFATGLSNSLPATDVDFYFNGANGLYYSQISAVGNPSCVVGVTVRADESDIGTGFYGTAREAGPPEIWYYPMDVALSSKKKRGQLVEPL